MNAELAANFTDFEKRWQTEWATTVKTFKSEAIFFGAFQRLVTMQAWRSEILIDKLDDGSLQFALEGQNDLLIAFVLARSGQWRSALQSQRAAIENYLNCLYFMDHPIELELWELQKHRMQFSELTTYFSKHPKHYGRDNRMFGLNILKSEYATLSKAVHGSAKAFRMSLDGGPNFFSNDKISLRKWDYRNRQLVRAINLLLISLFSNELVATRKRNLRKAITLSLRKGDKDWIKREYLVTIPFA